MDSLPVAIRLLLLHRDGHKVNLYDLPSKIAMQFISATDTLKRMNLPHA